MALPMFPYVYIDGFELILIFALLFAFVFGVFTYLKFFKKSINATIAFCAALLMMSSHYVPLAGRCNDIITIISVTFPKAIVYMLLAVLGYIIIYGIGFKREILTRVYFNILLGMLTFSSVLFLLSGSYKSCDLFQIDVEILRSPWFIFVPITIVVLAWVISRISLYREFDVQNKEKSKEGHKESK